MIDEHLGMALGLSTMASAAAGQVISDFSGHSATYHEVTKQLPSAALPARG